MDKNYYKAYYHLERRHWWFLARGEMLLNHLKQVCPTSMPLRILNVGAATGRSSELLMALGQVVSVEYDADCYEFVRQNVPIDIINGSILDLPFEDNSFDVVCAFDVIEHVADDALAVAEMQRVCKKGGLVCVSVPAFQFLWSEHDVVNHHFRRYTGRGLRALFEGRMSPVFQTYFNFWLFFPIALVRLVGRLRQPTPAVETAKSDFETLGHPFVNRLFYGIFKSEWFFLKRHWALPVGVSILSTWRK